MMSASSFDDSSSLVDKTLPSNGEQKERGQPLTEKQPDVEQRDEVNNLSVTKEQESKSKSKKSKAKNIFRRAKSPISGAITKTTQELKKLSNLPKHHYTSSPKSPCKSPSRENLTEEYSKLEQRLSEKTSEEWLAFQQMQERVKQTVIKTQSSLNKYASQSEDDEPKHLSTKWTGFNESGVESEIIDTSLQHLINITSENDQIFIDTTTVEQGGFTSQQKLSPTVTHLPKSGMTSMDNLNEEKHNVAASTKQEVDLLGLLDDESTDKESSQIRPFDLLSEDLLGLGNLMAPSSDKAEQSFDKKQSDVLRGYVFSASVSSESSVQGVNDPLMFECLNVSVPQCNESSNVAGDVFHVFSDNVNITHQPAKIKNAFSNHSETRMYTFENMMQPVSAHSKVSQDKFNDLSSSTNTTSTLDDLANFDPMKSSDSSDLSQSLAVKEKNPFATASSPIDFYGNQSSDIQGMKSLQNVPVKSEMTSGPSLSSNIEHDIFTKIKKMSSGSQPNSPARRPAPKPPSQKDAFEFVQNVLKKPDSKQQDVTEDINHYKPMAAVVGKEIVSTVTRDCLPANEIIAGVFPETNVATINNNPFLSPSFNENLFVNDEYSSENAAAVFGLEPENKLVKKSEKVHFSGVWADSDTSTNAASSWINPDSIDNTNLDAVFVHGDTWDNVSASQKVLEDAWGMKQEVDSKLKVDTTNNLFEEDDFSKLEDITIETAHEPSANPFLSDHVTDITDNFTIPVNPFLFLSDQQSFSVSDTILSNKSTMLSGNENVVMDSLHNTSQALDHNNVFDPFKVSSTASGDKEYKSDSLDMFSSIAASGDKQLAQPSTDDDLGFIVEIKPFSEKLKSSSSSIAPALKPPPKPLKSPLPVRENPFDKDSPPDEDFAKFEVKVIEKSKEPSLPKSASTESSTTEDEVANLEPLEPFLPECNKESFKLMLRYPTKKKIAGNRYWKNVCVKLEKQQEGLVIRVLNDARDPLPIQELNLQPCYSLSDLALQQYDQYGKIHTVKLQYVFYKERVGIKTERITPSIVKFKKRSEKPKAAMILDHSAQVSELLKFGSLDEKEITEFKYAVEDAFMKMEVHREKTLTYTKDEITAEVLDEYYAVLDKHGHVILQKARVRVFVLAFLTGMPVVEIGLNDRRRKGKEVVSRFEIIPIKTEEWIRMENIEFHCCVNKEEYERTNNIKFLPLDACQFELLRYRVRLKENKELPLQLTIQQIMKNRKCEIRCDLLVTGYHSYSKKHGQFPCEDIEVRFPIPEAWIYMFRYERRFGYGSVHSAARKPGKIKGLERLSMMAQGSMCQALMEADVGTAKYEHLFRAIVWRIPRLPIRNQGAYSSHLFRLKLELGQHDEIPKIFDLNAHVGFTMPCSTVSQSQIRSIAITNPNPPEKWVRSMARYEYQIEVEHLDEYPELLAIGSVYNEAARTFVKTDEELQNVEAEETEPKLPVSDSDSSDSD